MDSQLPKAADYLDRLLAEAPYQMLLPAYDGSEPMLIFGFRHLNEGITDMLRAAALGCKPVPTVLTHRENTSVPA